MNSKENPLNFSLRTILRSESPRYLNYNGYQLGCNKFTINCVTDFTFSVFMYARLNRSNDICHSFFTKLLRHILMFGDKSSYRVYTVKIRVRRWKGSLKKGMEDTNRWRMCIDTHVPVCIVFCQTIHLFFSLRSDPYSVSIVNDV